MKFDIYSIQAFLLFICSHGGEPGNIKWNTCVTAMCSWGCAAQEFWLACDQALPLPRVKIKVFSVFSRILAEREREGLDSRLEFWCSHGRSCGAAQRTLGPDTSGMRVRILTSCQNGNQIGINKDRWLRVVQMILSLPLALAALRWEIDCLSSATERWVWGPKTGNLTKISTEISGSGPRDYFWYNVAVCLSWTMHV